MITSHIMTETEKEIVASWTYPGVYAIYNMPSYQEQKEKRIALGDPMCISHYYSYYDDDTLIGFTNILEEPHEVFLGIGVMPNVCGQGYGQKILRIAQQISKKLYGSKPLYLEVRTWNRRAIECYEKAGFIIDGPAFGQKTMAGEGKFYRMIFSQEHDMEGIHPPEEQIEGV